MRAHILRATSILLLVLAVTIVAWLGAAREPADATQVADPGTPADRSILAQGPVGTQPTTNESSRDDDDAESRSRAAASETVQDGSGQQEPPSTVSYGNPGLNDRLAAEAVDPIWAPKVESTLESLLAGSSILYTEADIECRTTICRMSLSLSYDRAVNDSERMEQARVMAPKLGEIGRLLIDQEKPRLQAVSGNTVYPTPLTPTPDDRPIMTFYFFGTE